MNRQLKRTPKRDKPYEFIIDVEYIPFFPGRNKESARELRELLECLRRS